MAIFALMVRTLQIARGVKDKALSDNILKDGVDAALTLATAPLSVSGKPYRAGARANKDRVVDGRDDAFRKGPIRTGCAGLDAAPPTREVCFRAKGRSPGAVRARVFMCEINSSFYPAALFFFLSQNLRSLGGKRCRIRFASA